MRCKKNMNILLMKFCVIAFSLLMLFYSIVLSYTVLNEENLIINSKEKDVLIEYRIDNSKTLSSTTDFYTKLKSKIRKLKLEQSTNSIKYGLFDNNLNGIHNIFNKRFFNMSICGKNWTVYLFAFSLGAFWNVKHLKKIGIV